MAEYDSYIDSQIPYVGAIPSHWKTAPNKRVMHKEKRICDSYAGQDIISLTMKGAIVRDLGAGGKMPTTFDGYQFVYPGELLMCLFDIDVTPRCVGRVYNEGLTSPAYSSFVLHDNADLGYFFYYYLMLDHTKELLHLAKNLRHSLTEEQLGQIKVPLPPLEEQVAITAYLDRETERIDAITAEAKASIEEYKAWKASIIYGAVTKGLNPDVKMKDSGIEWIGQIPEHWKKCKIKQVADAYNGDRSSNYPSGDDIVAEGVPFITSNNLNAIVLTTQIEKNKFITEEKYNSLRGAKLQLDDIVFCLRGSVGKCSINKQYSCGTIASSLVVFRARNIHPDYLNYVLQNNVITEMALTSAIGIGSLNLSAENIMGFPIAIPPMEEQRKIAESLNTKCHAIEVIISEKEALVADLESYKKSLIFEVVTGKRKVV